MKFTHFEIQNFRGIQNARIDLSTIPRAGVYTLVGLNESGKTTVLEAINYFRYNTESLAPLKLSGYTVTDPHTLIPMCQRSNFNGTVSITYGLTLHNSDKDKLTRALMNRLGFRVESIVPDFTITHNIAFKDSRHDSEGSSNLWDLEVHGRKKRGKKTVSLDGDDWFTATEALEPLIPSILYFPNFLFDFPEKIYLEDTGENDDVHRFYCLLLQDILDALDNGTKVKPHILARAKSRQHNDQKTLDGLLLEMGRNVTATVFDAWNTIFHERMGQKKVVIDCDTDDKGYYVQFRLEDSDGYYLIGERSLGFRWFFVFLLLTQYRGFRKRTPHEVLFLFDEPASNLHPTAQAKLLETFGTLAQHCTIIYTTHSHHMVNPDWLETTYVVKNSGLDYKTDAATYSSKKTDITVTPYRQFVVRHPNETSYYQPILEVLDYYPSRLENLPDAIMVEGKNDFYVLKLMQSLLLPKGEQLNLLPGMGSSNMENLIKLYVAWGLQFIILLDADAEGIKQKARYEAIFETILEDRVFTLDQLDAAWRGYETENLFSPEEREQIQKAAYPDGAVMRKTHFNRAIQELLLTRRKVAFSETTQERFKQLFAFLKKKLNAKRRY